MNHMTNKARWRKEGNRQYIRVEVRPSAKLAKHKASLFQADLDWLPASSSKAWSAFVALQRVILAAKNSERQEQFYEALLALCEGWCEAKAGQVAPREGG